MSDEAGDDMLLAVSRERRRGRDLSFESYAAPGANQWSRGLDHEANDRFFVQFRRGGLLVATPTTTVLIAGDANGHVALLHEAADEGYIAGINATAVTPICFRRRTPIGIVFADPGVAFVGRRLAELDGVQIVIGEVSYAKQGRARTAERNYGLLRVYADREDGRLLGAEMAVPAAEHLAHLLALAIDRELDVHALLGMPFYHPVLEEGLRTALRDAARQLPTRRSDLAACEAFRAEALD